MVVAGPCPLFLSFFFRFESSFPRLSGGLLHRVDVTLKRAVSRASRAMIVPFLQTCSTISRYIARALFVYKTIIVKVLESRLRRRDRDDRSTTRIEAIIRRGFWRVLALEEFTDVQCVIVDLAMPSLAGYRIDTEDHHHGYRHHSLRTTFWTTLDRSASTRDSSQTIARTTRYEKRR